MRQRSCASGNAESKSISKSHLQLRAEPLLSLAFRWPCCRKRPEKLGLEFPAAALVPVKALFQYRFTDLALSRFCKESWAARSHSAR